MTAYCNSSHGFALHLTGLIKHTSLKRVLLTHASTSVGMYGFLRMDFRWQSSVSMSLNNLNLEVGLDQDQPAYLCVSAPQRFRIILRQYHDIAVLEMGRRQDRGLTS